MSHKRPNISRRVAPGMPLDNLSSPPDERVKVRSRHALSSPTRYKKGARTVQIPSNVIEDISSKTFVPSLAARSSEHTIEKRRASAGKHHDTTNDNESFEPIADSSPLQKRPKYSSSRKGGLIDSSSSPLSSPRSVRHFKNNGITLSYHIPGELTIIDESNNSFPPESVNMNFNTDQGRSPYATFIYRRLRSGSMSLNLNNDCSQLLFDYKNTCMGVILKKSRYNDIPPHIVKWRAFFWTNKDSAETSRNLGKISNLLMNSNPPYLITKLKKAEDVRSKLAALNHAPTGNEPRRMADAIALDALKKVNPTVRRNNAIFNKEFNSLRNTKLVSKHIRPNTRSALSIRPPTDSTDDNTTSQTTIAPKSFYGNEGQSISNHRLSVIRKSTRNKDKPKKTHNIDLEDEKRETPKPFKPSLKYKFEDGSKYTITNQDFKCLYNNDWINDTIIDFFTKYYVTDSISKGIVENDHAHAMSSFFYTKLISDPENYYDNVKKWVQNTDLITAKYIVVPINVNYHWFGCIIYNFDALMSFMLSQKRDTSDGEAEKSPESLPHDVNPTPEVPLDQFRPTDLPEAVIKNDSGTDESDDLSEVCPTIQLLTFDSLHGTHSRELDPIKEFLIGYAKDKYSVTIEKSNIKMKTCQVPQQPNMSDCGVHVILTIKKFFENPLTTIEVWRTAGRKSSRSSTYVNDYFERSRRNMSARKELRQVLWGLQKCQIKYMKENNVEPEDSDNIQDISDDEDFEIIEDMGAYQNSNKEDAQTTDNTEKKEDDKDNCPQEPAEEHTNIEESNPENNSLIPSEHLSSVPPSPEINEQTTIPISVISEGNPVGVPISVQLRDAVAEASGESSDSQDNKLHSTSRSDVDDVGRPNIHEVNHSPSSDLESQRKVSSKYFVNRLASRKRRFPSEESPLLSDRDHRLDTPNANVSEEKAGDYSKSQTYHNEEDSVINSDENIIVSDLERDEDVNLIGHSSNVSVRVNTDPDDSEDGRNRSDSINLEQLKYHKPSDIIEDTANTDEGISKLHKDISRELNNDETSNFVDLSSPHKPDTPSRLFQETRSETNSPSRIIIRDDESS
ncbi:SUMO protease [Maudiozyma humilis]|uniref:SUMO protease n=1 Tax=Maudiozyma humilis TaxID=51915 RepID=A0AAV5RVG4_MAUHU|nr:SUMO protease [Kazachstania humilis]